MDSFTSLAITLFLLSMINERIVNFFKLQFSNKTFLGIQLGNLKEQSVDGEEDDRTKRIIAINIIFGTIIALSLRADLISMIKHVDHPSEGIGWDTINDNGWNWFTLLPGCFFTGCFLSLGSKFWHDLVDTLLQIKNYRRLLADPDTFMVDNVNSLDSLTRTFGSEVIQAAYLKVKSQLMAQQNVIATGIRHDKEGFYISVTLNGHNDTIGDSIPYELDDGEIHTVRIVKTVTNEPIVAHNLNLSDRIANLKALNDFGSLGCLVRRIGSKETFLLTCYHNVLEPGSNFVFDKNAENKVRLQGVDTVLDSVVHDAVLDYEIDAAIIILNPEDAAKIENRVPGVGNVMGKREDIQKSDIPNNIMVFLRGAAETDFRRGLVDGVHCDVCIKYENQNHVLQNLISVSNNGQAITKDGDSGAAVLDFSDNLVGLVVAGDTKNSYIIPISSILVKLKLELLTT